MEIFLEGNILVENKKCVTLKSLGMTFVLATIVTCATESWVACLPLPLPLPPSQFHLPRQLPALLQPTSRGLCAPVCWPLPSERLGASSLRPPGPPPPPPPCPRWPPRCGSRRVLWRWPLLAPELGGPWPSMLGSWGWRGRWGAASTMPRTNDWGGGTRVTEEEYKDNVY